MSADLDSLRLPTAAERAEARASTGIARSTVTRLAILLAALLLLALVSVASLFIGSGGFSPEVVWRALTEGGTDTTSVLITDFRVPRLLLGLVVGCALGLAGAVIQAVTRNPLADPGILGVNSGAYFAVVVAVAVMGTADLSSYIWWSFAGAGIAAVVVYLIGSRSGATPVRLVLAGVALSAALQGVTFSITLRNPDIFDKIRFWQAGSLQNRQLDTVLGVLPFFVVGVLLALLVARSLNVVALGDDLATSLGAKIVRTRLISVVAITLLCGAATAAAGPIAFLGLMAPFIARAIVGPDQRWVLPLTMVFAPLVFVSADVVGRVIVQGEMPVGIVTAFVGAPVLVLLIRRSKTQGL
ncbi:iron chelate uptake ABC transporter family permease subunit [Herbiconiux sp. KACC 21604]|uniref:iron chelate uptake ABC transporter family permease subunit n=1 Tax=unclassified Herbiconiux TaxID=2618217 RepID=UPI001491A9EB|nr:iron chelate uptake ABC transporter family permease subunit [Herbiconiux sp. SALV-R1]QJU54269.1 iron chelate uptake ABC transporter family permease subunit [Herbiconiux sp. SALV-R1]WPO85337.1 iron chelate uptake ABC transporter family permease subunit [Herbiconiux sp. KACC 21604]